MMLTLHFFPFHILSKTCVIFVTTMTSSPYLPARDTSRGWLYLTPMRRARVRFISIDCLRRYQSRPADKFLLLPRTTQKMALLGGSPLKIPSRQRRRSCRNDRSRFGVSWDAAEEPYRHLRRTFTMICCRWWVRESPVNTLNSQRASRRRARKRDASTEGLCFWGVTPRWIPKFVVVMCAEAEKEGRYYTLHY